MSIFAREVIWDFIWGFVDIEFQTCYSNFLTVMYDTKEKVQRAYEIMREEVRQYINWKPRHTAFAELLLLISLESVGALC